jgi:hypothetical protein
MIVAFCALKGEAEDGSAHGIDTVGDAIDAELKRGGAAFVRHAVEAVESGGEFLLLVGIGKEVAGDVPGDELVVGHVVLEGLHDPVTIGPGRESGYLEKISIDRKARRKELGITGGGGYA